MPAPIIYRTHAAETKEESNPLSWQRRLEIEMSHVAATWLNPFLQFVTPCQRSGGKWGGCDKSKCGRKRHTGGILRLIAYTLKATVQALSLQKHFGVALFNFWPLNNIL